MSRLQSLSPFGPLFGKELRVTARRKRTYWLRVFYLGALLLVLLMTWASSSIRGNGYGGVAARAEALNRTGQNFFSAFSIFTVLAMAVLGPILTATTISAERLHKCLPVLLMTPLSSWQIIAGKLMSRLLVALSLIGLSLPVLAVVRLLGGVELSDMMAVLGLCVAAVVLGAAMGLLFSTFMNRAYATILLSYSLLGFLYIFVAIMSVLVGINTSSLSGPASVWLQIVAISNPILTVMALVVDPNARSFLGLRGYEWLWCVVTHLGLATLLLLWAGALLRRWSRRQASASSAAMPPLPLAQTAAGPATDAVAKSARVRTVSDHPILWREIRRPLMAKRWQRLAALGAVVALLLFSYQQVHAIDSRAFSNRYTHAVYAVIFETVWLVAICVLAATTIAHEKETDTWTLLLATPLSARSIVLGKIAGVLRRLAWPLGLMAAHFFLFAFTAGDLDWRTAVVVVWVMGSFATIFIASGTYLSLRIKRVTPAVVASMALPVLLYAVAPLVLAILDEIFSRGRGDWAEAVLAYLPYNYLLAGITEFYKQMSSHDALLYSRRLEPFGRITTTTFLWVTFGVGMVHILVSGLIVWWTMHRFDRIVGRADQQPRRRVAAPAIG